MPKKKPTKKDENEMAFDILKKATSEESSIPAAEPTNKTDKHEKEKNPAAVALGRLGGLKGGKARAEKLSAKKRKEIAKKAAEARWAKE